MSAAPMHDRDLTVDEALAYAARGWRIFPTNLIRGPGGKITKKPAIIGWPNTCSCDPEQIRAWWRRWPNAVISIVTGPRNGIVILDVDVGVDRDGRSYSGFDCLEETFGWWCSPTTPVSHTPRGGCHFWFSCPSVSGDTKLENNGRNAIRNSAGLLAPHIDIRGYNGQAVIPSAANEYWWDPHLNFDTVEMMPAPAWFDYRPAKEPGRSGSAPLHHLDPLDVLAEACHRIRTAVEGSRHDTYRHETFRVARLVGLGLLNERKAHNDLAAEVMALGKIADGHMNRVEKYFNASWNEGLAAGRKK